MVIDMSRVGNAPIIIPAGVEVSLEAQTIEINGPKGKLGITFRPEIKIEQKDNMLIVSRKGEDKQIKSLHGLYRAEVANMIKGVTEGWSRDLEMVGVGYRASGGEDSISLQVGFSHPVTVKAPEGVSFAVEENTKIKVSGIDKKLVGQIAANIRSIKPPEVYKGKGIRFAGEVVKRKPGKAGKALVGGAK